jgi:hypothetical protein
MKSGAWVGMVASSFLAVGCSGDEPQQPKQEPARYLGLEVPAPGKGFQVRSAGTTIRSGEDVEYCEIGQFPGDPSTTYYVTAIEFANGAGSHHLVMDAAIWDGPAEAELAMRALGQPVECLGSQFSYGEGFEGIGAIPRPYAKMEFPAGVGRLYRGGQRFTFNYHYFNSGTEDIEARSAANFYLAEATEIEHVARMFSFDNRTINTPPRQSASFSGECAFTEDVMVSSLMRHTHRWGTDYSVWFAGGPRAGEQLWTSSDWQHDVDFRFPEPVLMKAGEGFRFQCGYQNPEDRSLRYGPNATDEMCMLLGTWWSTSNAAPENQTCVTTRIGTDGVARPGSVAGFPKPSASEVTECLRRANERVYPGESEMCDQCACNGCGGYIVECRNDPDCDAIFDCLLQTRCNESTCGQLCGDVFNQHQAGAAKLQAPIDCLLNTCPNCVTSTP